MKTIIVASDNPVKVGVVQAAFHSFFPLEKFTVVGKKSVSGVPDQPMGEEEIRRGAENRLAEIKKKFPQADYWAAIEGGTVDDGKIMIQTSFIIIEDRLGHRGIGRPAPYPIQTEIAEAIRTGDALGPATDAFFGTRNIGRKEGNVSIVTNGLISRTELYRHGVVFALAQIVHSDWYE